MEKMIIKPEGLRGYGNISVPKSSSDFFGYNNRVGEEIEVIDDRDITVFTLSYVNESAYVNSVVLSVSNDSFKVGETVVLTAVVKDNENNYVMGETVTFYREATLLGESVTDSDGVATFNYTPTIFGQYDVSAYIDDHIMMAEVNFIVIPHTPTTLTLTNSRDMVSAYHDMSLDLTATLLDEDDNPIQGETITFQTDDAVLGTSITDSDGVATYTYTAQGVGDFNPVATVGDLISNSTTVQDCIYAVYDELSFSNGGTITKVNEAIDTDIIDMSTDWELSFDLKATGGYGGVLSIGAQGQYSTSDNIANYRLSLGTDSTSSALCYAFNVRTITSNGTYPTSPRPTLNTYYNFRMTKEGITIKAYYDDNLIATKTAQWLTTFTKYDIYAICWSASGSKISTKSIKIKPL